MIFIFTEALKASGLGHLGRCTALGEILQESGEEVSIILHTDGISLGGQNKIPIQPVNWKEKTTLENFLTKNKVNTSIVDSYLASETIYQILFLSSEKLVCIDDTNRISYPQNSIILNPGFGGNYLDYNRKEKKILTGVEFVLLRKPFREKFNYLEKKKNIESILITVGGDDRMNLVPEILKILKHENFDKCKKEIIIGPSFKNREEIKKESDSFTNLYQGLNAEEIRDLMLSVDLAITAGGQTTYELARCGIPMIILETIDNQKGNVKGFFDSGISSIIYLDEGELLLPKLKEYLHEYTNFDKRRETFDVLVSLVNPNKFSAQVYEII